MLRAAFLTLVILLVLPAAADAACRTAPVADVWYDSPAVQVWFDDHGIVACVRATGTERVVRTGDEDVTLEFSGVYGERWLSTDRSWGVEEDDSTRYSEDEHAGSPSTEGSSSHMLDLYTGAKLSAPSAFDVPGGQITTGPEGTVARYTDGRTQLLDLDSGEELALQGRRLYWRTATGPHTARLALPARGPAATPRRLRPATKMARCTPQRGARLVARHRRLVITRVARAMRVCFNGRTTALADATRVEPVFGSDVAYRRPGRVGYLDASTGKRKELPSAGGPIAADLWTIAARDRKGVLRVWGDFRRPMVITRKPATEIALSTYDVYWLAADGTPRVKTFDG
ncbi:hypothetical protein C8N24_2147 [Solirubrobacter pauli]|uniref:Uncharacterized protein n=1 Tax=Solirubrobacter pauli TaxID=166793 RepID=A0A660LET6_9ACTN|nr:hypothetical protein [Solirubrobacter pauli]RKQ92303.1 hypothetical protein C8N24_2147 [Solirubrobacter pauli]